MNTTEVFVTDLLTSVTTWPVPPAEGPLDPTQTNETLFNSSNGFNTTLV